MDNERMTVTWEPGEFTTNFLADPWVDELRPTPSLTGPHPLPRVSAESRTGQWSRLSARFMGLGRVVGMMPGVWVDAVRAAADAEAVLSNRYTYNVLSHREVQLSTPTLQPSMYRQLMLSL